MFFPRERLAENIIAQVEQAKRVSERAVDAEWLRATYYHVRVAEIVKGN